MQYIKLIGIKFGDFSSSIEFEQNYSVKDFVAYKHKKEELERQGSICVLTNVDSNLKI